MIDASLTTPHPKSRTNQPPATTSVTGRRVSRAAMPNDAPGTLFAASGESRDETDLALGGSFPRVRS